MEVKSTLFVLVVAFSLAAAQRYAELRGYDGQRGHAGHVLSVGQMGRPFDETRDPVEAGLQGPDGEPRDSRKGHQRDWEFVEPSRQLDSDGRFGPRAGQVGGPRRQLGPQGQRFGPRPGRIDGPPKRPEVPTRNETGERQSSGPNRRGEQYEPGRVLNQDQVVSFVPFFRLGLRPDVPRPDWKGRPRPHHFHLHHDDHHRNRSRPHPHHNRSHPHPRPHPRPHGNHSHPHHNHSHSKTPHPRPLPSRQFGRPSVGPRPFYERQRPYILRPYGPPAYSQQTLNRRPYGQRPFDQQFPYLRPLVRRNDTETNREPDGHDGLDKPKESNEETKISDRPSFDRPRFVRPMVVPNRFPFAFRPLRVKDRPQEGAGEGEEQPTTPGSFGTSPTPEAHDVEGNEIPSDIVNAGFFP